MMFKKHILASSVAALMLSTLAYADGENAGESTAVEQTAVASTVAQKGSDKTEVKTLDAVVVTGVRGGAARTVTGSPVPIDVVKGTQLQATGKGNLMDALASLLPSFNVTSISGGGTSYLVRSPNVRGLNGDQVLVLVNGKRRHNTALLNDNARVGTAAVPVDLALIPTTAIERVEVLRDGAAAQYGSDAIAGVINVILKKDDHGGEVESFIGQNYKSDGAVAKQSLHVATALGDQGGFFNFSLEARLQEPWDRAGDAIGQLYRDPNDPRNNNRSGWGSDYGLGKDRTYTSAYNFELPIADKTTLYSFSTFSYRDAYHDLLHRKPTDLTALEGVPGAPYPDGPQARRNLQEVDYQIAAGLKTELADWALDFSTTYGKDDAKLHTTNNANLSYGVNGKHEFLLNTQAFEQWTTNADISRLFDIGLYKPVRASAGVEYRWENFKVTAGESLSYSWGPWVIPSGPYKDKRPEPGLISVAGVIPEDAGSLDRKVYAGYLDFNFPVTKAWDVGLAGRYEKYDGGVGDTTSGKLSTRFEFLPNYAFRAAISNGFRAPSVAQSQFSSTGTLTTVENGQQVRNVTKQLRVDSPEAAALGASPLKPELSTNYSFGFTAKPASNINFSVDVYQIDIDDRIVKTSLFRGPVIQKILQDNGLNANLVGARYYTNGADTQTRGIDVVAEYLQQLGDYNIGWLGGQVKWSLAYNHNKTEIKKLAATPAVLAALGPSFVLFDRQQQSDLTKATPKDKLVLGANYSVNNWWLNLQLARYGEYTEAALTPADDRTFSSTWITDLEIGKQFNNGLSLAVGANNLFNKYPDEIGVKGWAGGFGNGLFAPYGFNGGFYYGRLNYKF